MGEMMNQMSVLLEMLQAAKADDMDALADAEARATKNKERMKRSSHHSSRPEQQQQQSEDRHGRRGGHGRDGGRDGKSGRDRDRDRDRGGSGKGRRKRDEPPTDSESSSDQDRDQRAAAAAVAAAAIPEQPDRKHHQQHEGGGHGRTVENGYYDSGPHGAGGHVPPPPAPMLDARNMPYPEEWEDDSRDMTRTGDSATDLTRTTNEDDVGGNSSSGDAAAMHADRNSSGTEKDDELRTRQTGTTATMTYTGTSSSHHAAHNNRNGNSNGRGSPGPEMPLKPPASSRGELRSRSDEVEYGRIAREVANSDKRAAADNRRRSNLDEPLQRQRPAERKMEKVSENASPDGRRQQRVGDKSDDWGDTQAEHYMQEPPTNRDLALRASSFGSQGDLDDDDLSHHTREEMGPPIGDKGDRHRREEADTEEAKRKRLERREETKEQSSSNIDADIQSRVLRQLENDDDEKEYLNDDDEYYDSDESSDISDITSPTFATYQDPPTVCDDGSVKGARYGPGSRFAGMTAAQVAAHANRVVNKRHRADGKSVESDDEKSKELEKRLRDDSAVKGGTGTVQSADQQSSADGRPGLDDRPPPPSLAGDLKPPSMRSMLSAQQKQQHLEALREQQEVDEKEQKAEVVVAADREREEEERIEVEKRRKAEEEEEAVRRADQEARERARARQQEMRERLKREMLQQQRKQEEMLAQQMQEALAAKQQLQEEPQESHPPPPPRQSSPPQQQQPSPQQQRQLRHSIAAPERGAAGTASHRRKHAPGPDPNRRSLQNQSGRGAPPQQRRPATRRPTQPGAKPNASAHIQRPERAQRTVSAPSRQQQQQLRGSRRNGESKMAAALSASKGRGVSPTSRGEAHHIATPDKFNRSGSSSGRSGGSDRSGIRRFSDIGSLLKAKAKFKGARNSHGTQPSADTSSHAADKASGRGHTRRKPDERDSTLIRKGLLGASTNSTTYRKPVKNGQRHRPSRKGGPWAESAAWKQPIREEDVNKNLNPNNVDIEKMMNSMGKDIDFIFRELSVFEEQQEKTQQQKTSGVDSDIPPNPAPEEKDDGSDSDEGSLIATAKIKYTLGSLATTLKQEEKGSGGRRARKSRAKQQQQDGLAYKNSHSLPVAPTAEALLPSGVGSKSADPLLIDEDGFIISPSPNGPTPDDTFGTGNMEDVGEQGRRSIRTSKGRASAVTSRGMKVAPSRSSHPGSDLMAAKRRELQGYQDKQKVRQSQHNRQTSDDNSIQDTETLATTDPDKVEADVAKQVMALAAGKKVHVRGSTTRTSTRKDHGGGYDDDDSIGLIPSNVPDLDKGERNFSTIDYDDDDDDISKIDAVEAATKNRIEMLRQVVAEKAAQLSAIDKKPGRGGAGHTEIDDDELTHKLDFVEQETMKQISRLRRRYSAKNVNSK